VPEFHIPFQLEPLVDERSVTDAACRAVHIARTGDPRAGLALAMRARRRARDLDTVLGEVEALNAGAIVHLIRGDAMAAAAAALDAAHLACVPGTEIAREHARVTLSLAALTLEARDDIAARLADRVASAVRLGDCNLEIRARVAYGIALGDAGSFDDAARQLNAALRLALTPCVGMFSTPARVTANIANLYRKRAETHGAGGIDATEDRADAIRFARRACVMAIEEGSVPILIDGLAIHGRVLVLEGRLSRARALFLESIATGRSHRCRTGLAWVLCELAKVCVASDDISGARQAYTEALEVALELAPSRKVQVACAGLAEVEGLAGNEVGQRHWTHRAREEAAEYERMRGHTRRELEVFFAKD
jgi:tetratricopeptide (TPR) repeat protein